MYDLMTTPTKGGVVQLNAHAMRCHAPPHQPSAQPVSAHNTTLAARATAMRLEAQLSKAERRMR